MVWSRVQDGRNSTAAGDFLEWNAQSRILRGSARLDRRRVNLATGDRPEQVEARSRHAGVLTMMARALGRDFLPEEGQPGRPGRGAQLHVLAHAFGKDPAIVDQQIRVDGKPRTVVGVLAPGVADRPEVNCSSRSPSRPIRSTTTFTGCSSWDGSSRA